MGCDAFLPDDTDCMYFTVTQTIQPGNPGARANVCQLGNGKVAKITLNATRRHGATRTFEPMWLVEVQGFYATDWVEISLDGKVWTAGRCEIKDETPQQVSPGTPLTKQFYLRETNKAPNGEQVEVRCYFYEGKGHKGGTEDPHELFTTFTL